MIDKQRITLIAPCRNEAGIIGDFVRRVPSYIDEIIVVDNNSTDESVQEALEAGAWVIKEKRTIRGIGYGYAHQAGMAKATGDIIVAMDGDDTYPVHAIPEIIRHMNRNALDFVSCARLPLRSPRAISAIRKLGIHILNLEVRLLYGYTMRDILTGMWTVRKDTAKRLQLREGNWNFSPEIKLAALADKSIAFAEYHINHFSREHAISKQNIWKTGLGHAWYIFQRRLMTVSAFLWFNKDDKFMEKAYETI